MEVIRHFVLFKTILVALLAVNANATPSIGSVTELEGSAAVFRKELRNEADLDFGIESYDVKDDPIQIYKTLKNINFQKPMLINIHTNI